MKVVLVPEVDNVALYALEPGADMATLARQKDGRCVYLNDEDRCTIYPRRPFVCRTFDCRALLVTDVHSPVHVWDAAQQFEIAVKQPGDREFLLRTQAASRTLLACGRDAATAIQQALAIGGRGR